jgi:hypothetical protein
LDEQRNPFADAALGELGETSLGQGQFLPLWTFSVYLREQVTELIAKKLVASYDDPSGIMVNSAELAAFIAPGFDLPGEWELGGDDSGPPAGVSKRTSPGGSLRRSNDTRSMTEALEWAEERGLNVTRRGEDHLKIGRVNYHPESGLIRLDYDRPSTQRGLKALAAYVDFYVKVRSFSLD